MPRLLVRCPRCAVSVDTGFRVRAGDGVADGLLWQRCAICRAEFFWTGREAFEEPGATRPFPS